MVRASKGDSEGVVERYFAALEAIQGGNSDAVEDMLSLWDDEGRFAFVGAPPVTGQFQGRAALTALYRNLASSRDLKVRTGDTERPESVLASRRTRPVRQRAEEGKVTVQWTSDVETEDGRFFTVAGTNTFQIRGGKIAAVDMVISPRPGEARGFKDVDLDRVDIGRLSLAAWAVV